MHKCSTQESMLKASHVKISLNSLETRKFSFFFRCFHCPTVLFERFSSFLFSLCQLLRAGLAARSAGPGSIPLWGEKKSMATHPFPSFNTPNKPAPDAETGRRGPLLRSPNSPVLMEKVPSENLLSQNFNGLAKRLLLPSGGAIISQEQVGCWKDGVVGDVCRFGYTFTPEKACFSSFALSDLC